MTKINETSVITTPRLSGLQRDVMKTVYSAESGRLAYENIIGASDDDRMNDVTAVEVLAKIGLIDNSIPEELTITDQGNKVMQDENLIDQAGQVVDDPETNDQDDMQQPPATNNQPMTTNDPITQTPSDASQGGLPPLESLILIQAAHKILIEKEKLSKLNNDH